jgi:hypothetical protein
MRVKKMGKEAKVPLKRGELGGGGSEGRARNDADTTQHYIDFPSLPSRIESSGMYLNYATSGKKRGSFSSRDWHFLHQLARSVQRLL